MYVYYYYWWRFMMYVIMLLRCILLEDINFNKLVIVGILWEEIRGWGEVEWVEWSGF